MLSQSLSLVDLRDLFFNFDMISIASRFYSDRVVNYTTDRFGIPRLATKQGREAYYSRLDGENKWIQMTPNASSVRVTITSTTGIRTRLPDLSFHDANIP